MWGDKCCSLRLRGVRCLFAHTPAELTPPRDFRPAAGPRQGTLRLGADMVRFCHEDCFETRKGRPSGALCFIFSRLHPSVWRDPGMGSSHPNMGGGGLPPPPFQGCMGNPTLWVAVWGGARSPILVGVANLPPCPPTPIQQNLCSSISVEFFPRIFRCGDHSHPITLSLANPPPRRWLRESPPPPNGPAPFFWSFFFTFLVIFHWIPKW